MLRRRRSPACPRRRRVFSFQPSSVANRLKTSGSGSSCWAECRAAELPFGEPFVTLVPFFVAELLRQFVCNFWKQFRSAGDWAPGLRSTLRRYSIPTLAEGCLGLFPPRRCRCERALLNEIGWRGDYLQGRCMLLSLLQPHGH